MKYLYKKFNLYLPRLNYNLDPMLYITNSMNYTKKVQKRPLI